MKINIDGRDRVLADRIKKIIQKRKEETDKYQKVASQLTQKGEWKALSSFLKNDWTPEKINKLVGLCLPIKSSNNKTKAIFTLLGIHRYHHDQRYSSARLLIADPNNIKWKQTYYGFNQARENSLKVFITEENKVKIIGILMGLENE